MKGMIKGLLEYSRVGRGGEVPAPVSCQAALDEALANLRQTLEETQAQVTRDTLPTVVAYGPHLPQDFGGAQLHIIEPDVRIEARLLGESAKLT